MVLFRQFAAQRLTVLTVVALPTFRVAATLAWLTTDLQVEPVGGLALTMAWEGVQVGAVDVVEEDLVDVVEVFAALVGDAVVLPELDGVELLAELEDDDVLLVDVAAAFAAPEVVEEVLEVELLEVLLTELEEDVELDELLLAVLEDVDEDVDGCVLVFGVACNALGDCVVAADDEVAVDELDCCVAANTAGLSVDVELLVVVLVVPPPTAGWAVPPDKPFAAKFKPLPVMPLPEPLPVALSFT